MQQRQDFSGKLISGYKCKLFQQDERKIIIKLKKHRQLNLKCIEFNKYCGCRSNVIHNEII